MHGPARIFVYGTLKRGEAQEVLLGFARRTDATTRGRLYALPAGYPALALEGNDVIHGELVELVEPRTLELLDHYEGVDEGLYRRVEIDAIVGLRRIPAWTYVMDQPRARGGKHLPSGRWTATRRR